MVLKNVPEHVCLKNVLLLASWRASHILLSLVVLQFCKLINTSPVFSNCAGYI